MIGADAMGSTNDEHDIQRRAEALAHTEEPTSAMIAASAADGAEPTFAVLGASEELSGGAGAMYLREISNHDLLSMDDEVRLAQLIERGREAASRLASDEALSELERERQRQVVDEGEAARRHLIECNLRLVVSVARRYAHRGLSFLDLVQEGNIGLQIGVDKYDWRRGYRLSTYIYWWIRQAITRSLADQSRTIRLPVHAVELLMRILRAERELLAETGREPSVEKLAETLGMDVDRIVEARRAAQVPLSIEAPLGEDSSMTRGDLLDDEMAGQAAHREIEIKELSTHLSAALASLEPRERCVLEMRFGLPRGEERTLSEVAEALGVSRERIRQIEQAALAKLRRLPSLRRDVVDYLAA